MFIQLPMSLSSADIWSWAELFGHSKTAELFRNQSSVLPVSALTCPPASVPPGAPHYLGLDSLSGSDVDPMVLSTLVPA